MKILFLCGLLLLPSVCSAADDSAFVARQRRLLEVLSTEPLSLPTLAGRFATRVSLAQTLAAVESLGHSRESAGAFHGYALMALYLRFRHLMTEPVHRLVRETFRSRGHYRGDTENHWVMYYTGLYLAAQTWPGESGTEWFNGKSSDENLHEAEGWLNHWITLTTTIGQGEFDSPTYMPVFLSPMLVLADFAIDPMMRTKTRMMCDLLLADFAAEHLRGSYGGGHSRDYPADIVNPLIAQSTRVAWLFFGEPTQEIWENPAFPPRVRGSWEIAWAAVSDYRMPDIILKMATDRSVSYVHRERKRVRNVIRFRDEQNPPVFKYTYMTSDYVLGSLQGGILQPFQQHTWDVTFVSPRPFNTIFTVHPSHSKRELGMFFPEELNVLAADVDRYKLTYTSPDKWNSSSPYEQTFQHRNALIVLYNIEAGAHHPHIDAFFPGTLDERTVDPSGWIFCRAGNTAVALFPLKPFKWIPEGGNWRLRSHPLKNGAVVEVGSAPTASDFEDFVAQIRRHRVDTTGFDRTLTVAHTTLGGDRMRFTFDGPRILNDTVVTLATTRLYDGPFLSSDVGSGVIELRYRDRVRVLDFRKGMVEER